MCGMSVYWFFVWGIYLGSNLTLLKLVNDSSSFYLKVTGEGHETDYEYEGSDNEEEKPAKDIKYVKICGKAVPCLTNLVTICENLKTN
jgi:hypothetical protein